MEHAKPGTVLGRAFSGTVVAAGTAVPATHPQMRPGVRVAGLASQGAFAEYVRVPARVVWTVPANAPSSPLTDAQAAAMGSGLQVAVRALFSGARGLGLVRPPRWLAEAEWVFVHGGTCEFSEAIAAHQL